MICGTGALISCTATKLKYAASRSENTVNTVYSDSSFTGYHVSQSVQGNEVSYDAIWWLKGNVHFSPDSGFSVNEVWMRLQGEYIASQQLQDSTQYSLKKTEEQLQINQKNAQENQKIKDSSISLPWWVYLLLLGILGVILYRIFNKL